MRGMLLAITSTILSKEKDMQLNNLSKYHCIFLTAPNQSCHSTPNNSCYNGNGVAEDWDITLLVPEFLAETLESHCMNTAFNCSQYSQGYQYFQNSSSSTA